MAFSIQTNINSLVAQENLRVNSSFQSHTIQRLTSGYRINSSADDAAGLAVANRFRSDTAELQQGVRNANDGVSQLQIIDGGLANISQMLDRMKTLATQSASATFTGDRATLQSEYSQLASEIDRQAQNIQLNNGGNLSKSISVYLGGAHDSNTSGSSSVSVDLSGKTVDQTGLAISGTSVSGGTGSGAVDLGAPESGRIDDPSTLYLQNGTQALTFNYVDTSGATQSRVVTVNGGTDGLKGSAIVSQINTALAGTGLTVAANTTNGQLSVSGTNGFTVLVGADTGGVGIATGGNYITGGQYHIESASQTAAWDGSDSETFTISDGTYKKTITLAAGANTANATAIANYINTQLAAGTDMAGAGTHKVNVTALVVNDKVSFQSGANFTVTKTAEDQGGNGVMLFAGGVGSKNITLASATGGSGETAAARAAITAINSAVSKLATIQGIVGAGQNKLAYAISLAQSQITNFSAAEAQIRDADVASEAANLTKAQVLQQASIAAMAQANSAPQAVLSLLRG